MSQRTQCGVRGGRGMPVCCDADPLTPLMAPAPPVPPKPPRAAVPPVASPGSLGEHGPGDVQVSPAQGQAEGDAVQLVEAAQDLCPALGAQEGAAGVVPLTATTKWAHAPLPDPGWAPPYRSGAEGCLQHPPLLSPEGLGVEEAELQGLCQLSVHQAVPQEGSAPAHGGLQL